MQILEIARMAVSSARNATYCTKIVRVAELPTAVAVMLLPVICKVPVLVASQAPRTNVLRVSRVTKPARPS